MKISSRLGRAAVPLLAILLLFVVSFWFYCERRGDSPGSERANIDTSDDLERLVSDKERAEIYSVARAYLHAPHVVEGHEWDLIFQHKEGDFLYFKVIPEPTDDWVTDDSYLGLKKIDGKWTVLGLRGFPDWGDIPGWE